MKELLETKTAAVAAVPANSTLVLFAAVVAGNPTAAQIETARYSVAANLENVGATATSAYLTRFEPVELNVDADEGLLLEVDASLSKVAPGSVSGAVAPEPLELNGDAASTDENDATSSSETPPQNDATSSSGTPPQNDATSSFEPTPPNDATSSSETPPQNDATSSSETPLDENAAASDAPETPEA